MKHRAIVIVVAILLVGLILSGCNMIVLVDSAPQGESAPSVAPEEKETSVPEEGTGKQEKTHEHSKLFVFQPQGSTAASYVKPICESGEHYYLGYTLFDGTPDDLSYLEVVKTCCEAERIIGGEYYTITATVELADYDLAKTRIRCAVRSGNISVNFSVEFKDEYEESVGELREGDEVIFRGRFYDEGCGFTDCELIPK